MSQPPRNPDATARDNQPLERQVVTVLSRQVYEKLEAMLVNPVVSDQTSELSAGYKLGIQYVLSVLRRGFVLGS